VNENALRSEETFETVENMNMKRVPEVSMDRVVVGRMIVVEEEDDDRWVAIFKYEKKNMLYMNEWLTFFFFV
jgi:hypothetical protein